MSAATCSTHHLGQRNYEVLWQPADGLPQQFGDEQVKSANAALRWSAIPAVHLAGIAVRNARIGLLEARHDLACALVVKGSGHGNRR
jgi:hypothetical protein